MRCHTTDCGQARLLTPRTIQAHCTYLSPEELSQLAQHGTAIAHCPLSNAYFSARQFVLREALDRGVRVGLGTDVAGGYSIDVMGAMRWAVGVSRLLEGARLERSEWQASRCAEDREINAAIDTHVRVDWKEALYLGTRGGALALGLGGGVFKIGAPFDAQQSWHLSSRTLGGSYADFPLPFSFSFQSQRNARGHGATGFF